MTRVVLAVADQALAREIQSSLVEIEDMEVAAVAVGTGELTDAVMRTDPDILLVHDMLGPDPVLGMVRDIGIRRPATAALVVSASTDGDTVNAVLEAGARGMVALPLSFGQLQGRLTAAAEWSARIRRMLAAGPAQGEEQNMGRAKVVGLAGSKGGVGVTTLATHITLDIARTVPGTEVCLIDMDLEKGDVPALVEVRHRLGIADLAKVSDDLSPGTVADAMSRHESGVDMLLAPTDIRDVEAITPRAFRQVLAAVRREYDLVVVDLGSHVTPAQATALELCDEVVMVVNPDVASLRGMRRTFNAWESLGVFKETDVRVVLNRASKQVTVSMDTVRQLTRAQVVPTAVPAAFRRLEVALNVRDPLEIRNPQWWSDLRRVGRDLNLLPQAAGGRRTRSQAPAAAAVPDEKPAATPARRARRGGRRARAAEAGSAALETVAMMPVLALFSLLAWHVAMLGYAAVLQGAAASAASREYSMTRSTASAERAAEDAIPFYDASRIDVQGGSSSLQVSVRIPAVVNGYLPGVPTRITSDRKVVMEP